MTNPVMIVRTTSYYGTDGPKWRTCWMWCPGCEAAHSVSVVGEDGHRPGTCWDWDGDMEHPTFSPSILVHHSVHLCPPDYEHDYVCEDPSNCGQTGHLILNSVDGVAPPEDMRLLGHTRPHIVESGNCHSFLRAGRWEFLGDCAHTLAGQTVDMVPLPDWLADRSD